MKSEEIRELYNYHIWANQKLLDFCQEIGLENLTHNFGSSFSSIRDTLVHILGAEELWLSRWQGEEGRGLLIPQEFPSFELLSERWSRHDTCLGEFIDSVNDEGLKQMVSYKNLQGIPYTLELWKQMLHVTHHSTYHRGQVVTMIRQLNLQPPSLDLIYYYLGSR